MTWSRQDDVRSADGTRLALWRTNPPSGAPKGDVLLVHGFAEHMGRYTYVAETLVAAGYRVTGLDLRGHGISDGKRGFVRRWSNYTEDVIAAMAQLDSTPILVSHSMGGLVVLDLLREHHARAAVFSAPLLRPTVAAPRWKTAAARVLSRLTPSLSMANELDGSAVTRDTAIAAAYNDDPLVFGTVTPRWFTEMNAAAKRVYAHGQAYKTPALFMIGTDDKIVDVECAKRVHELWGGPKEQIIWPGLYHELFNEPERADVLARTVAWIDRQS